MMHGQKNIKLQQ